MLDFIINSIFLLICSYTDIKNKNINIVYCVLFGLINLIIGLVRGGITFCALGIMPGILLLIVSYLTNEKIGYGDGIMLVTVGLVYGISRSVDLCMISLSISGFVSLILLLFKKKKINDIIAFAPYLFLGNIIMCFLNNGVMV